MKQSIQEKTFELLEATGLNWSVKKEQLSVVRELEGNAIEHFLTDSYGIMKGNKHLGTVGKQYQPFQNHQLAETIIEATETVNITANRGGSLCDETKIYLQAQLADEHVGKSGIKRWITATNSHDGSSSIGFGSSNTVVVCQNTFHKAHKELNKFRHTINASERIKLAITELKNSILLDERLMLNFKRMADLPMQDEIVARVLKTMFKVDAVDKLEDVSSRKINQMQEFNKSLNTSITEQGKTVWALFNAVTRYTNHVAGPSKTEDKQNYLMDGGGFQINNSSFEEIMKWVNANSEIPEPIEMLK